MRDKVEERLKKVLEEFIKTLELTDSEILDLAELFENLNSVKFIKLLVFIENEFNIEFEDADLDGSQIQTFDSLSDKICELIEEQH